MQSPKILNQFESRDALDKPPFPEAGNILSLPNELLLRVISFLSNGAIRNLMVDRRFRSLCEKGLYRSISLPGLPGRSLRLLETFLLRPELALMVQHLELDLEWIDSWEVPQEQNPSIRQPDGMKALSLAKNLHSLCLWGVDDWIWEPTQARYRETIFNMKLARIEIPGMSDVKVRWSCTRPRGPDSPPEWDGDLGAEIRKLLQAQPLLEDFTLTETAISGETLSSLEDHLQPSDIPKLKSLEATPDVAAAFFSAGPGLESLNLLLAGWGDFVFSKLADAPAAARLSIRRYSIRVWYSDEWIWSHLAKVFALFPNVEHLSVAINSLTSSREVEYAKHYFDKVASSVHALPLVRSVKVQYETLYPETPGIFEVEEEAIAELKMACPLLETVVDPKGEMWGFSPKHSSGEVPKVIGRVAKSWNEWQDNLPLGD